MERRGDRGAALVEFALVLPLLAMMTIGIIAFGYMFHIQSVLDNAARDGVRVATLTNATDAVALARSTARASASSSVALAATDITVDLRACATAASATNDRLAHVTIELEDFSLLGLGTITLTGTGSMRCNG